MPETSSTKKAHKRRWPFVAGAGVLLMVIVVGTHLTCSDFGSRWSELRGDGTLAGTQPATTRAVAVEPDYMAGRWEGKWISDSDMDGKLQAILTKREDGKYDAIFHAQVAGLITTDQSVTFTIEKKPGVWEFNGKKDLGWLKGGMYTYTGTCDGEKLTSTYSSKLDTGRYEMKRYVDPATTEPTTQP